MTTPSHNAEGHQTWNPSVGRYFDPASDKRESYAGIIGSLQDQIYKTGSDVKAYPHNFAGIIAAIEDLTFSAGSTGPDIDAPAVKPPGGSVVIDGDGNPEWIWTTPPADGEMWFDTRQGRLFVSVGGEFYQTNGADGLAQVTTTSTAPATPVVGQFWWDQSISALYIFDGFWDDGGTVKDHYVEGATPIWRLIVEDGGGSVGTLSTGTLPFAANTQILRDPAGSILPDFDETAFNVQKQYNEWLFDALEALEAAIEAEDFASPVAVAATAPASPTDADLWYDTAESQLKVYHGSQWVATTTPRSYDNDIVSVINQISAEQTARTAAIAGLTSSLSTVVSSSSIVQNIQTALSAVETDLASRPTIDTTTFATTATATGLDGRLAALESAHVDFSNCQTQAQALQDYNTLNTAINDRATKTELQTVENLIPSITGLATPADITTAINGITVDYLPRTGGTLTGSFNVEKADVANSAFDFSGQKSYSKNTHKYLSNGPGTDYATFGTNDNAWEYAWNFGSNEDFCWNHGTNGKIFSINKDGAVAKDLLLADFDVNNADGVVLHNTINLRTKLTSYDSQLAAITNDINALEAVPRSVYYSDDAPTGTVENGNLWFDSSALRLYVRHSGAWIYPDRVEDTSLKTSLLNAVNSSTDYTSLKANLITALN